MSNRLSWPTALVVVAIVAAVTVLLALDKSVPAALTGMLGTVLASLLDKLFKDPTDGKPPGVVPGPLLVWLALGFTATAAHAGCTPAARRTVRVIDKAAGPAVCVIVGAESGDSEAEKLCDAVVTGVDRGVAAADDGGAP